MTEGMAALAQKSRAASALLKGELNIAAWSFFQGRVIRIFARLASGNFLARVLLQPLLPICPPGTFLFRSAFKPLIGITGQLIISPVRVFSARLVNDRRQYVPNRPEQSE